MEFVPSSEKTKLSVRSVHHLVVVTQPCSYFVRYAAGKDSYCV